VEVDPGGVLAVSRFEDVQYVIRNPKLFSSEGFAALLAPAWLPHNPMANSILGKDDPAHAKLRALVNRAFTSKSIERLEPRMREIVAEHSQRLKTLGECDYIVEYALPIPAKVIAELIGVNPALYRDIKRWTDALSMIGPVPPAEELVAYIRGELQEMEAYLQDVVTARRKNPENDMVTTLVQAVADGQALTDEEIISFLFLLLPAGFETTHHLLANAMQAFIARPDDFARLRADPGLVPSFVDELLRHDGSIHGLLRIATTDTEIGGTKVPQGAMLLLLPASANRDESKFPDPDRFDMSRNSMGGLSLGHGVHYCLGAALARMQARLAIEELARCFRGFELLPGEIRWNTAIVVRGPTALPIRVIPA